MFVENDIVLYADSPSEVIGLMQKLYPSSQNEERCFLIDHVNASVYPWDKRTIEWMKEDYGFNVNWALRKSVCM